MPKYPNIRAHVAFFICPEYADTIPTLSVVDALVIRGCRVSYVTTERFAHSVSELGAEFLGCPPISNYSASNPAFDALTRDTLSGVKQFYELNKPDVIIHDTVSIVGRILAHSWGIPTVQVSPDFKMDKSNPSRQAPEFFKVALEFAPAIESVLKRYEIEADLFLFSRAKLNIYFYSELFQLDNSDDVEECLYAGCCAPQRPHTERWKPHGVDDRPVILVSTSTLFSQGTDYFKMCIDALSSLRWHVVLQLGEKNDPALLEPLPAHFEIVRGKPQIAMLPYVDLLICAGGMMTTMEAMYWGVPILMITHGNIELEAYADNNVRLGLGRHLRKAATDADTIRDHVIQMSKDNALLERVREVKLAVRAEPGAEEVANRICEYMKPSVSSPVTDTAYSRLP